MQYAYGGGKKQKSITVYITIYLLTNLDFGISLSVNLDTAQIAANFLVKNAFKT